MKNLWAVLLCMSTYFLSGQTTPQPCLSPPNGPGCDCSTAGILCTPDVLDGFTFTMSSTPNIGGLPGNDLCPPANGIGGTPNNVNWFAFIAWCTDLDMNIVLSNCARGTQGGNQDDWGVQVALFATCGSPWNPVECLTDSGIQCGDNSTSFPTSFTLSANGLTIGNTYYFMVDGCFGSTCDVTIDVIGTCGTGVIDPWTTGITGPLETCVGNTDTYTAEDLDGAVEYYYYLDGVPLVSGTELYTTDITWTTPGTYQLCVDVSNLPCIPESDPPGQSCITIMVCDAAEAGTISALPQPACPGETVNITVSGNTASPDHVTYLIITDPTGAIIEVINGSTNSITRMNCETLDVYSYNVKATATAPTVGTNFPADYPCNDNCCDSEMITVTWEDNIPPSFTNPPADITFDCQLDVPAMVDLDFTDNCIGAGLVPGVETGTVTLCGGGSLQREWVVVDSCTNRTTHTQNITVNPIPAATYANPPADVTITCDMIPTSAPDLTASNGLTNSCGFSQVVSPTTTGTADLCGGVITNMWSTTDNCNNLVEHMQTITVTPVPPAVFNNPPADITITCDLIPTTVPDLTYTNSESGSCEISGIVIGTTTGTADLCGGVITNTWQFTDACNRTVTHQQTITVNPVSPAIFINPPADITVTCDMIPTTAPDLQYTNSESGACEIAGTIPAVITGTADQCGGTIVNTWSFTDPCNRLISHQQTITVTPIASASFINPPADITVACDMIPPPAGPLSYDNGVTGACGINGQVNPTIVDNSNNCGGTIQNTWTFTDPCNNTITHTQTITIDPAPQPVFVNPPADITVDCNNIPTTVPSLMITNGASGVCLIEATVPGVLNGTPSPCGGTVSFDWTYTDACGRTTMHSQSVTINPAAAPVFDPTPPAITVSCDQVPSGSIPLDYSNGETGACAISGSVNSVRVGTTDECGGNIIERWNLTDACGRSFTTFRNITVDPAPEATWINPPGDITINCADIGTVQMDLNATNSLGGTCAIDAVETAIESGVFDACGGSVTQTWTFTDDCGRSINHSRVVTLNPAPDPVFVDPPADITLDCDAVDDPPQTIVVSNGLTGLCEITDVATLTSTSNGNLITNEWTYTNPCNGNVITHTQLVTTRTSPDISISPSIIDVCEPDFFDLTTITVTDANGGILTITYHDFNVVDPSNEIDPLIQPFGTSRYYINATNEEGCNDVATLTVFAYPKEDAGQDVQVEICKDGTLTDLTELLDDNASGFGFFFDLNLYGIDVSDPRAVNLNNLPSGIYDLYYITDASAACPSDTAVITITLGGAVDYEITSVNCSADNSTYSVIITTIEGVVTASTGSVNMVNDSTIEVVDIAIADSLILTIGGANGECQIETVIQPPNCSCPNIPTPTGTPEYKICSADVPLTMEVTVAAGLIANWYDSPNGGTNIASGTSTFQHTNTNPGLYQYYVEAEDPTTNCVSLNRLRVSVEVVGRPIVDSISFEICDDNLDGIQVFDLGVISNLVSGNPNNVVSFYTNLSDATNAVDTLVSPYTNQSNGQIIIARVVNATGCVAFAEVELLVLTLPLADLTITDETCMGDQDGSITINPVINNGVTTSLDNEPFIDGLNYDSLSSRLYSLSIIDTFGCRLDTTFVVESGLEITLDSFSLACDNKGTLTDPTDDEYVIVFNLGASIIGSSNYNVTSPGGSLGEFDYNSIQAITLPADGSSLTLTFTDSERGCTIERSIGPLNPCSTNCEISIETFTYTCDNNGTDDNPQDDTYTVTLLASSINGATNNRYTVLVDGQVRTSGTYGEELNFILPANGGDVTITLQDSEDDQCQSIVVAENLLPCSNGCAVLMNLISVTCDNNGTVLDDTDDFYEIVLLVVGINTGNNTYNLSDNGLNVGSYNYGDTVRIQLPADGTIHDLEAIDELRPDCFGTVSTSPLINCSSDCSIQVNVISSLCDNQGTNDDAGDDTYTVEMIILGGQGGGWIIPELNETGNYGNVTLGPLLIADGDLNITIQDNSLNECMTNATLIAPPPCSGCSQTMELIGGGTITCTSPSIDLEAIVSEPGDYLWTFNGGVVSEELTAQATNEGYYVFLVTFADQCSLTDSIFVASDGNIPVANGGPDQNITCLVDSVLLDGSMSTIGNDIIYVWTNLNGDTIGTSSSIMVDEPGSYFLQVIDIGTGCASGLDQVVVNELTDLPSVAIYANPAGQFDCIIAEIILSTDEETGVIYSWITPEGLISGQNTLSVTQVGTYDLIGVNSLSGCIDTGSIEILSFEEYPIINLEVSGLIDCDVDEVTLSSAGSQTGATITYTWINPNGEIVSNEEGDIIVDEPGQYILQLADSDNGCTNADTIEVESLETEIEVEIETVIFVNKGDSIVLNPIVNIPIDEIDTIIWSPTDGLSCTNCLNPTVIASEDQTYTVTIIDIYGCVGQATVTIRARVTSVITIPDIISIGSENGNDAFIIYTDDEGLVIDEVLIYDRWGNNVFRSNTLEPNSSQGAWRGNFNNEEVTNGVYVYFIQITTGAGEQIKLSGDLTVVR